MASRASVAPDAMQPQDDQAELPVENHGILLVGIMLASLVQILDSTIANVALPHMQSSLGATADTVTWVLTSYIIASAVAMPITGWLADRVGARRLFLLAVAGFVVASMLCGIAQSLEQMVVFRVLQGIGGAFIAPLSQSFMLDTSRPSRHPQVMALWGMGIMIGPILGPLAGGWLTESANWRWVFYVNVPLGAVAMAILVTCLPHRESRERKFDLFGFALFAVALTSLQLLLDRGMQIDWFESGEAWIYLVICLSAAWMLVIHFRTSGDTLYPVPMLANRNFIIALVFMILTGVTMFATMALLPPMLQRLFGYDVIDTGIVLMPRGVGILISMQLSGYLIRRFGLDPRTIIACGLAITVVSMWQMAHWSLDVDQFSILMTGFLQGAGMGLVFIPLNVIAFATLKPHLRTDASSLLNLTRSVGASIGISLMSALWAGSVQTAHEELGGHVTANLVELIDLSMIDRFQALGEFGLKAIDSEVNRQAFMIGYINDFYLMMWMCALAIPLCLLMRKSPPPVA